MTTALEALIGRKGEHAVGYLNVVGNPRQIDGGAMCSKDMDNFELVELFYENDTDEVISCKPITDENTKGYILYSSEVLHDSGYETKLDFYNGKGTMGNVWVPEEGITFKVSNFKCESGEPKKGMYAQYVLGTSDVCPKANGYYKVTSEKPQNGENIFLVTGYEEDVTYELLGIPYVELRIML